MQPAPAASSPISPLVNHYASTVLPLWTGPGWHAAMALPFEALAASDASPLPVTRYRAMACARQLYVFSAPDLDAAHAHTLFASLQRYFADPDGGWYYSVDAGGVPLDTSKDLYTHAFVVFACAAYYRRTGRREALAVLERTVALIEAKFACGGGLYRAALAQDFSVASAHILQNPIMHLTEAYLAVYALAGDGGYAERLRQIADGVVATFVDPANGCVAELPLGSDDNRVEPGHQFEWFSLAAMSPGIFQRTALPAALQRAFAFATQYGVAPDTQGVAAALDAQGNITDPVQRIWAQTEYARALRLHGEAGSNAALRLWAARFRARFLHARGWHECIAPDGSVVRAEMPSTTPYHLATSYQALAGVSI